MAWTGVPVRHRDAVRLEQRHDRDVGPGQRHDQHAQRALAASVPGLASVPDLVPLRRPEPRGQPAQVRHDRDAQVVTAVVVAVLQVG